MAILGLVATYGYFHQGICWAQNAHYDLARSVADLGTVQIDAYHYNTGDTAKARGHYYSNKAPGLGLLAVPVVKLVHVVLPLFGERVGTPRAEAITMHLAMLACVSLPTALAALALGWIALSFGAPMGGALATAAAFALGGPVFVYATLFWSHALTAALLTFSFAAAVALREKVSKRLRRRLLFALSLSAGVAVLTEYQAFPAAVILTALGMWKAALFEKNRRRGALEALGLIALGALPCAAILLGYQAAAFGSPFAVSYEFDSSGWDVSSGFVGVGVPKLKVMLELLFGSYRGILMLAPVLILAPFGFWRLWRDGDRAVVAAAVSLSTYYFLLNAAYAHWHGGWSYGPRYLSPALPFVCLGLAPLWKMGRWARVAIPSLIAVGFAFAFMAAATKAQVPNYFPNQDEAVQRPVTRLIWPAFKEGRLSLLHFWQPPTAPDRRLATADVPWNVGHLMGLDGLWSLLPLVGFWLVLAGLAAALKREI